MAYQPDEDAFHVLLISDAMTMDPRQDNVAVTEWSTDVQHTLRRAGMWVTWSPESDAKEILEQYHERGSQQPDVLVWVLSTQRPGFKEVVASKHALARVLSIPLLVYVLFDRDVDGNAILEPYADSPRGVSRSHFRLGMMQLYGDSRGSMLIMVGPDERRAKRNEMVRVIKGLPTDSRDVTIRKIPSFT